MFCVLQGPSTQDTAVVLQRVSVQAQTRVCTVRAGVAGARRRVAGSWGPLWRVLDPVANSRTVDGAGALGAPNDGTVVVCGGVGHVHVGGDGRGGDNVRDSSVAGRVGRGGGGVHGTVSMGSSLRYRRSDGMKEFRMYTYIGKNRNYPLLKSFDSSR